MFEIPFVLTEVVYTVVWLIIRVIVWLRQHKIDCKREAILLLMYINLAVIIRVTFFPMEQEGWHVLPLVFDASAVFPFRINLIPMVNLFDYDNMKDLLLNVIGNAAMFVPSGIILPIIYKRLDSFLKVIAAGAGISFCIELLQLPFSVRASDIDDVILNTLGVIAGYGIFSIIRHLKNR